MQTKSLLAGAAAWLIILGATQAAEQARAPGYMDAAHTPDASLVLGPPPADGSGAKAGDVATYNATRKLQGTARWDLAARDADYGPTPMLKDYSCALGVALDRKDAPVLYRMLDRLTADAGGIERAAKDVYKRPRPFVDLGGQICVDKAGEDSLRKSYSYPSGHSTYSWTAALALEQIAPDRAAELMARARSYGESRIVCGVHYQSDVQAGRATASLLFSALQDNPTFRADLVRARAELARLRAHPPAKPEAAECAVEAEAAATPIW